MPRPGRFATARFVLVLALSGLVSACQTGLPGAKSASDDVTPNAVVGDAIEVTALDAPPGTAPAAVEGKTVETAAEPGAKAQTEAPALVPTATEAVKADPAPQPDLAAEVAAAPKSDAQIACEKKRGRWTSVGKGDLSICLFDTKDAGKRCDRESQCEGSCLARSGTCAPFKPLLGCNEILQDNGARVTQCIE